jgi:hypothetical protein
MKRGFQAHRFTLAVITTVAHRIRHAERSAHCAAAQGMSSMRSPVRVNDKQQPLSWTLGKILDRTRRSKTQQ